MRYAAVFLLLITMAIPVMAEEIVLRRGKVEMAMSINTSNWSRITLTLDPRSYEARHIESVVLADPDGRRVAGVQVQTGPDGRDPVRSFASTNQTSPRRYVFETGAQKRGEWALFVRVRGENGRLIRLSHKLNFSGSPLIRPGTKEVSGPVGPIRPDKPASSNLLELTPARE